jgi:hypothetical protein
MVLTAAPSQSLAAELHMRTGRYFFAGLS